MCTVRKWTARPAHGRMEFTLDAAIAEAEADRLGEIESRCVVLLDDGEGGCGSAGSGSAVGRRGLDRQEAQALHRQAEG